MRNSEQIQEMWTPIRDVYFKPYLEDKGPEFALHLFDVNRRDNMGKHILGYKLYMHPETGGFDAVRCLFDGSDFSCSPMHAIDSAETVASLMSFLALRPGDTDADYFEWYTPEQLAFADEHAEALMCEVGFWATEQGCEGYEV